MTKLLYRIAHEAADKIYQDGDCAGKLVWSIIRHAASLYELAGVEEDFYCKVADDTLIFGRINHLKWSAEYGFHVDPKQSTQAFQDALATEGVTA